VLATEGPVVSHVKGVNLENSVAGCKFNVDRFMLPIDQRFIPYEVLGPGRVVVIRNDRRKEKVGARPFGLRAPNQKGHQH
jgi:hypothetical protein